MAKKYNNLPELEEKTSFEKLKDEYEKETISQYSSVNPETSEEKIREQIKKDTVVLVREN
jgi:hypothetical protein